MSCRLVSKWGEDSGWWADRAIFGSRLISPTAIYCNRDIPSLPMYSYILMWYLWNIIRSTSMLNYWKQDMYYDKYHDNNETTPIKGVSRRILFIKTVVKNHLMVIHGWILLYTNVAQQRLWQNTNRSSCRWNKPAHSNKTKILWRHKQLKRGDTGRHNKGAGWLSGSQVEYHGSLISCFMKYSHMQLTQKYGLKWWKHSLDFISNISTQGELVSWTK